MGKREDKQQEDVRQQAIKRLASDYLVEADAVLKIRDRIWKLKQRKKKISELRVQHEAMVAKLQQKGMRLARGIVQPDTMGISSRVGAFCRAEQMSLEDLNE